MNIEQTIEKYKGLVIYMSNKYRHLGLDKEDLIQEGIIGLMQAIDRYDPNNGASFGTYAYIWIKKAMMQAIQSSGSLIRIPAHKSHEPANSFDSDGDIQLFTNDNHDFNDLLLKVRDIIGNDQLFNQYIEHYANGISLRDISANTDKSHETVRKELVTANNKVKDKLNR